ncbi:MAG: alpha/beta hydrolase [Actinomycetes bacterium]
MRAVLTAFLAIVAASVPAPVSAAEQPLAGAMVRLDMTTVDTACGPQSMARVGAATQVPLLLLNGTGSPASEWDPSLLASLARTREVIVWDYPGLGTSTPLRDVTFDALADCAASLVVASGAPKVDVLGWSMGGFVAQRLAVRHRDVVRRLVLVGTNPGGPRTVLGPDWVQVEDSDPDASLNDYVRTNYPPGHRDRGWAFIARLDQAVSSGCYRETTVPAGVYDQMVAAEGPWLASSTNARQLMSLRLPALVMVGVDDVITPAGNSERIAAVIPGARLVRVPHAGHSVLFSFPVRTARSIAAFLSAT